MTIEKRILAARANGALSRGPKTPEGKARSSKNATRHGLLSDCVLLRNEDGDVFRAVFNAYLPRTKSSSASSKKWSPPIGACVAPSVSR
jgi:hypothetical protein